MKSLHGIVKKEIERIRDSSGTFVSYIAIQWDERRIKSITSDGSMLTKYDKKDAEKKDA